MFALLFDSCVFTKSKIVEDSYVIVQLLLSYQYLNIIDQSKLFYFLETNKLVWNDKYLCYD
jgi:hypothetical protein